MLYLEDFAYNLPDKLIAIQPKNKRDLSRLLVLDKDSGQIEHKHFFDIADYLQKGDVLVLNNSKVLPARLIGQKKGTHGKVEIFLHKKKEVFENKIFWECLVGGKNIQIGQIVTFSHGLIAKMLKNNKNSTWLVEFNQSNSSMMKIVEQIGQVPLPPYIKTVKRQEKVNDKKVYQTVYADDNKLGSVAAPTAGLHFTPELLAKIKKQGVKIKYITLHVGLGTFAPVKTKDIRNHQMHAEWIEVSAEVIRVLRQAKNKNKKIIAVGTTSVRALESLAEQINSIDKKPQDYSTWINIFIYPGYRFQIIDAMITNFHLPKSSLLMLVSALANKENIDKAYQQAIEKKYRFYSYGDAMFIK